MDLMGKLGRFGVRRADIWELVKLGKSRGNNIGFRKRSSK